MELCKSLYLDEGLRRDVVSAHLQEPEQALHDAAHVLDLHDKADMLCIAGGRLS